MNRKNNTLHEGGTRKKGCCKANTKKLIVWLENKLFFTLIITLTQEGYIQLFISGIMYLQIPYLSDNDLSLIDA